MNLLTNPKDINPGDSVFMEYDDDKKAFGVCVGFKDDLIQVDYTTEQSKEQKIDAFQKGFWKKEML